MIFSFIALTYFFQHTGLVFLVFCVQCFMYKELVTIAITDIKSDKPMPGFKFFYIYWFLVAVFYVYGNVLLPHLRVFGIADSTPLNWIMSHHGFLSYTMYIAGFVGFVLSLTKNKEYMYQFKQFAFCHVALLVVVGQSSFFARLIFKGLLWFLMPVTIVILNDTWAYFCGMLFGRTSLIRLSPKKTWEGFIGGLICTIICVFFLTGYLTGPTQGQQFLLCSKVGFSLSTPSCALNGEGISAIYEFKPLSEILFNMFGLQLTNTVDCISSYPVNAAQIHAVMMAIFGSLVAPFGGFFASGFKRAFGKKDFANTIPGHGGFVDRMDCQMVMSMFAFIYYAQFIGPLANGVSAIACNCSLDSMIETFFSVFNTLRTETIVSLLKSLSPDQLSEVMNGIEAI
eukprot:TRINITY_DN410_c0_g1_i1.p1 TRINITY_DN410_c0_g1~~TRINITY_DN410_c0_g1_i1.p1  ORF type:complete len:449 (+),score=103.16 TRINITY_DN410_c0_g1_i1:156-1349(+)